MHPGVKTQCGSKLLISPKSQWLICKQLSFYAHSVVINFIIES